MLWIGYDYYDTAECLAISGVFAKRFGLICEYGGFLAMVAFQTGFAGALIYFAFSKGMKERLRKRYNS
jgi:hypothetical protein